MREVSYQARAILIENNQIRETDAIRPGQFMNVSEQPCAEVPHSDWIPSNVRICAQVQEFSPELRELFHEDAPSIDPMMTFSQNLQEAGWMTGIDVIRAAGNGVLAADAGLAASKEMLADIQRLGRELVKEATAKLGRDVMTSKQPAKLLEVQKFLRASPKYLELQQALATLPSRFNASMGRIRPTTSIAAGDARWLRRQFTLPEAKGPSRYLSSVENALDGKIVRLARFGCATTFALPAVIGIYNIARASPEERFRIGIEESVAIGLGAFGAEVGLLGGGILVAFLGFSGVGAFLLLFVAAGTGAYLLSEGGKWGLHRVMDLFE